MRYAGSSRYGSADINSALAVNRYLKRYTDRDSGKLIVGIAVIRSESYAAGCRYDHDFDGTGRHRDGFPEGIGSRAISQTTEALVHLDGDFPAIDR
ncbi:MAG: hypothetical protein Q8K68_08350 [Nitrospirota bacterium]|nr:hypothetical protein [Nitrospirota bacterium]